MRGQSGAGSDQQAASREMSGQSNAGNAMLTESERDGWERESLHILKVAERLLVTHFEVPEGTSKQVLENLLEHRADVYDEDMVHHEGPWLVAAAAAYFAANKNSIDGFAPWLAARGSWPPDDALRVIRAMRQKAQ